LIGLQVRQLLAEHDVSALVDQHAGQPPDELEPELYLTVTLDGAATEHDGDHWATVEAMQPRWDRYEPAEAQHGKARGQDE
jgi:hypothetical protein